MSNRRINVVLAIIFLFGLATSAKLFFIQIVKNDFYKALAQGQTLYNLEEQIKNTRGEISFKGGEPLAINVEWPLVSISPNEVLDKERVANELSLVLNIDKNSISDKLKSGGIYFILKKQLNTEEVKKIKELDLWKNPECLHPYEPESGLFPGN
ncbi:MAG: hypothetical protein PHO30_03030 [Candidatus Omnitrophica bacterium]|nr:hypothetical protein [Candidatus Omnitrophota bacterium]